MPLSTVPCVLEDICVWISGYYKPYVFRDHLDPVTYPKSVSSIPGEGSGELSKGKLTDNWKLTSIKHGSWN